MNKINTLFFSAVIMLVSACAVQPASTSVKMSDTPEEVAEMLAKAQAGDLKAQEDVCATAPGQNSHLKLADMGDSWCEKAAAQGSIYAMLDLSMRYDSGMGRDKDPAQALKWLQRAVSTKPLPNELYAPEAYATMAQAYEYGLMGLAPNQKKAAEWHLKAANADWTNSYLPLARHYESGIGVRQNFKKAVKWYTAAAEAGQAEAQLSLALLYMKGLGVRRDEGKALFWSSVATGNQKGRAAHYQTLVPYAFIGSGSSLTRTEIDGILEKVKEWNENQ